MAIRKPEKGQIPVFVWSLGTHTLRKTSVTAVTHLESSKKIRKIPDDFPIPDFGLGKSCFPDRMVGI